MSLIRFSNRKAMILWMFGAVWMSFLLLMTWDLVTDGFPPKGSPYVMLGTMFLFWCVGIGMLVYFSSLPCVDVTVDRNSLQVTWRYPFRVRRATYGRGEVERAMVAVSKDGDGDPYFTARARAADGRDVDFAESHERTECEVECARFNEAFFREGR